jgi:hypothetical protein
MSTPPFLIPSCWMSRMEDLLVLFPAHVSYLQQYFSPTPLRRILGTSWQSLSWETNFPHHYSDTNVTRPCYVSWLHQSWCSQLT